tara:strand:+ start:144 stop:470 length:327 start_codon:yes stop_codon:yes gene_type:complete
MNEDKKRAKPTDTYKRGKRKKILNARSDGYENPYEYTNYSKFSNMSYEDRRKIEERHRKENPKLYEYKNHTWQLKRPTTETEYYSERQSAVIIFAVGVTCFILWLLFG